MEIMESVKLRHFIKYYNQIYDYIVQGTFNEIGIRKQS